MSFLWHLWGRVAHPTLCRLIKSNLRMMMINSTQSTLSSSWTSLGRDRLDPLPSLLYGLPIGLHLRHGYVSLSELPSTGTSWFWTLLLLSLRSQLASFRDAHEVDVTHMYSLNKISSSVRIPVKGFCPTLPLSSRPSLCPSIA